VEAVSGPDEVAPVYNMKVEGYHTYFVGSPEWGFSVWVHNGDGNDCSYELTVSDSNARNRLNRKMGGKASHPGEPAHHVIPWDLRDHPVIQRAAKGGFNFNGRDNGIWLDATVVHRPNDKHLRYTREVKDILDVLDVQNKSDEEVAIVVSRLTDDLKVGLAG